MEKKNTARVLLEKFVDIREAGVLMPLLLAMILFAANSDKFFTVSNLSNVMRTAAFTIITSIGQAFLIIAGSWDISVGAVYSIGGVTAAALMAYYNVPIGIGVVIALVVGALFGAFNGLLVQVIKLPPFIATMGTMYAARGLCTGYTKGVSVYPLPDQFLAVGQKDISIGNYEPSVCSCDRHCDGDHRRIRSAVHHMAANFMRPAETARRPGLPAFRR